MNTRHRGEFNILLVATADGEHIGICPEFAIVKYGDSFEEIRQNMLGAARAYLDAAVSNKLPHELLNRNEELPTKFQLLYQAVASIVDKNTLPSAFGKLPKKYQQAINTGNALLVPVCA